MQLSNLANGVGGFCIFCINFWVKIIPLSTWFDSLVIYELCQKNLDSIIEGASPLKLPHCLASLGLLATLARVMMDVILMLKAPQVPHSRYLWTGLVRGGNVHDPIARSTEAVVPLRGKNLSKISKVWNFQILVVSRLLVAKRGPAAAMRPPFFFKYLKFIFNF